MLSPFEGQIFCCFHFLSSAKICACGLLHRAGGSAFWYRKPQYIKDKELSAISTQKFGKRPMECTGRRDPLWSQLSSDAVGQYCTGERGHEEFLCSGKKAEQSNSPLEGLSWEEHQELCRRWRSRRGGAATFSSPHGVADLVLHRQAARKDMVKPLKGFAPLSLAKRAAEWMIQEMSLMMVLSEVSSNSKFRVFSYSTTFLSFILCRYLALAGKAVQKLWLPRAEGELQLAPYHCKTSVFIKRACFAKIRKGDRCYCL